MNDLTASEVSNLMAFYMTNTMASFITADMIKKAENLEVRRMLEFGLKIADEEVKGAELFLRNDKRALPEPFTEKDILQTETKYYSDKFVILLKYKLAQDALSLYGLCLSSSTNPKVSAFYKKILNQTAELMEQCIGLLIKNGMHQPLINVPRNEIVEKIKDQEFLGKLFGKTRSLSAPEVLQLTNNYVSTEVFHEILSSFCNTKRTEISEHFKRGKELCLKQLETIQGKLEKDGLPQLPTWETEINTEERAPYSERLMLFKVSR